MAGTEDDTVESRLSVQSLRVGAEAKHLPAGAIVEVNNKRNHAVRNGGDLDRVHFIFECYNVDDYGKHA